MLSLILSPIGKYLGIALGILLLLGLAFGWYEVKLDEARKEALLTFNNTQLEEVIKEKNVLAAQNELLQGDVKMLQENNDILNKKLDDESKNIDNLLSQSKDVNFDPLFNQMLLDLKGKK